MTRGRLRADHAAWPVSPASKPVRDRFPDFADLLGNEQEADLFARLRAAESIGRPLGDDRFVARLERITGRLLKPGKRGAKAVRTGARLMSAIVEA